MSFDLEATRQRAIDRGGVRTHWQGCEADHDWCRLVQACDEIERLEARVQALEAKLREHVDCEDGDAEFGWGAKFKGHCPCALCSSSRALLEAKEPGS